jgi:hypothetical protein
MFSTRTVFLSALILFQIVTPASLVARDASGSIRGTVLDSMGGRIAQASIVLVSTATGLRFSATSDAEGGFAFDLLRPGDYSARTTAQGMSPQVTPQLHVDVGAATNLDFQLTVAGTHENLSPFRERLRWLSRKPVRFPRCSTNVR